MRLLAVFVLALLSACHSRPARIDAGPPIVLLTVAGLRADAVGALGGPQGLSPHLDAFFSTATWSGTAIASSDRPEAAMASIFTGLLPWQHGLWLTGKSHLFEGPATLASALAVAGYESVGFYGRPELGPRSGLERGFSDYRSLRRLRSASRRLAALGPTWQLIWIQLDTLLPPFVLEPRFLSRLGRPPERLPKRIDPRDEALDDQPETRRQVRALYEMAVARTDELFGRLLADLQASGQAERAIVIVFSDIGTELGDRVPLPGRRALRRKLLEIPLAIRLPAGLPPLAVSRESPVAITRVFSTLLESVELTATPAVAPSLFVPAEEGILSESYRVGGFNLFSFFERGLQLQWISHYRPLAEVGQGSSDAASFLDTPALTGLTPGPLRWLERWTPAGGTQLVDDPDRQGELEASLQRTWLLFQEGEPTPRLQAGLSGN